LPDLPHKQNARDKSLVYKYISVFPTPPSYKGCFSSTRPQTHDSGVGFEEKERNRRERERGRGNSVRERGESKKKKKKRGPEANV
jgi:hypothetical protein